VTQDHEAVFSSIFIVRFDRPESSPILAPILISTSKSLRVHAEQRASGGPNMDFWKRSARAEALDSPASGRSAGAASASHRLSATRIDCGDCRYLWFI
jgi:hypothetical protein